MKGRVSKMYKILLVGSVEDSRLLIGNMKREAIAQGIEAEIQAAPVAEAEVMYGDWDVVLLAPPVRYAFKKFSELGKSKNIPVEIVDWRMYGMLDGKGVLNHALKLLKEAEK